MEKKHIGVLMGGKSAERDISLKSGTAIADSLIRQGWQVTCIDVSPNVGEDLRHNHIDLAFLALHGPGGEDGSIQGFLEVIGLPYTGSGIAASAVGMNKVLTKSVLKAEGLPTPPSVVLTANDLSSVMKNKVSLPFSFPAVVKPVSQGSSIGVSVMHDTGDVQAAYETAREFGHHVLVEQFIAGEEFTVGVIGETALPVLEILLEKTLFDFDTKYEVNTTPHAVRATISQARTHEMQQLALQVHQSIGCRGISRVDIRVDDAANPFVLEINTIPGMTNESLVPLAARELDIQYDSLVKKVLSVAMREQ